MIRTIEAIELTIDLAQFALDTEADDGFLDFAMEEVVERISMQAEHLENTSRALVNQAKQLKADVETRLES